MRPSDYEFASVDFTPNYLCNVKALHNIHSTARNPDELRFIVLMRDPISASPSRTRTHAFPPARARMPSLSYASMRSGRL